MTDTIREQILSAISTKLGQIVTENGYQTNLGDHVFRSFLPPVDFDYLPAVGFMPLAEDINRHGHVQESLWNIQVQGVAEFTNQITAAEMVEIVYADIIECILGIEYSIDFNSGGTYEPSVGDTITGGTSAATGFICGITVDSGTWAGGDAAGSFTIRRKSGDFTSGENINIGANSNVATTASLLTGSSAANTTTGDLADAIRMVSAETKTPDSGEKSVGASIVFQVSFKTQTGNPYAQ